MTERATEEATYIYGLLCPTTQKIRYVGASINPVQRLRQHLTVPTGEQFSVKGGLSAKRRWISGLQDEDLEPELVVLETVGSRSHVTGRRDPQVAEAEDRWMVKLLGDGHPLTNTCLPAQLRDDDSLMEDAIEKGRAMFG